MWIGLFVIIFIFFIKTFQRDSDIDMPVLSWWTYGFPGSYEMIYCAENVKCLVVNKRNTSKDISAYLFYGSAIDFDDLPLPRKEDVWALYHEESPRNVPELMHQELLEMFNFSATFSRYSDVPHTLQYLMALQDITDKKYFVETKTKNLYLKELAPILYLQSDCETATERDEFVKKLMTFVKVDSYGACLNNKALPNKFVDDYLNKLDEDEFLHFVAKYKFVIAIENGVCEDYITEKLWRAIRVGSVPIYFGSPTVKDWLPYDRSAVLIEDYGSIEKLAVHLKKLLEDDNLYEKYLQHKLKGTVTNERLVNELKLRPWSADPLQIVNKLECLVCENVYENLKGHKKIHKVSKDHYNCPKPVSASTLQVNPDNSWVFSWQSARIKAEELRKKINKIYF